VLFITPSIQQLHSAWQQQQQQEEDPVLKESERDLRLLDRLVSPSITCYLKIFKGYFITTTRLGSQR
jgi:hypothetical protein